MYKLLTIDVWDTLLRRKGHPDFSKLAAARALNLRFGMDLAAPYKNHWAIFRERCAIEGELASASQGGEYDLQDVLVCLLSRVLVTTEDLNLSSEAKIMAEIELQFELRHTYPDKDFPAFVTSYPAEQTLFLSDFYMSGECIQRLLKHHGLDGLVSEGISSRDVGLNKRSGALFHYIHERFGVTPAQHVHIGDNLHADVDMPKTLGVKSVHFQPLEEHRNRRTRESFLHERVAMFRHLAEEVWQVANDAVGSKQGQAKSAYLLGVHAAPLFVGFMLLIAERALLDGVEKLFFFTREGEFFIQLWRTVFPDNRLAGLELPPASLLEVSRLATFRASLREISTTELMRLWNLYSTQSIFGLLKTLGLEPDELSEVCKTHGLRLEEDVVYPWQDARVQAFFQDPRFVTPVKAKINDDRRRLLAYLDCHGWSTSLARIGVVDIGWRGTIQDNLAYLFPACRIAGYYLGLQRFLNQQPENCAKSSFGPDANKEDNYLNLLDAISVVEMLCNSINGSVVGYSFADSGDVSAIREIDEGENDAHRQFATHFQQGALFASILWGQYVDSNVIASGDLRDSGLAIWHELVSKTNIDLSAAYAKLNHNEVFGLGKFVNKGNVPSVSKLFLGVISRKARQEVVLYLRQVQWVSGIWGRHDLNYFHKLTLVSVMKLGLFYKSIRRFMAVRRVGNY